MIIPASPEPIQSAPSSYCRVLVLLVLCVITWAAPAAASADGNVTFSWKANPPEDNVIGYRLYYGTQSRFSVDGTTNAGFSYEYYIDFSDQTRCILSQNSISCEALEPGELHCENLYQDVPRCTISNLYGQLFFSLKAYNAQAESYFTPELTMAEISGTTHNGIATIQKIVSLLLLNDK